MIRRIASYIYNFGLGGLLLRLMGVRRQSPKMTVWRFIFSGVSCIGHYGLLPTFKSIKVARLCKRASRIRIFLTVPESWGGGAAYYLNEQIRSFTKDQLSLVVSPSGLGRSLVVRVYVGPQKVERVFVDSLSALNHLPRGKVEDVVVSTIVAWHDVVGQSRIDQVGIAELMRQILAIKHANKCKLLYLLHDYYCVCPRLFLVGDDGQYCRGEFTGDKCNECCAQDVDCVDRIAGGTDVMKWRKTMNDFLREADEIRAFCADTIRRMNRVFPQYSFTLVPHPEPRDIMRKPTLQFKKLQVGVIGNISCYKGAAEVVRLSRYLETINEACKIVVIGNLRMDNLPALPNVIQTGSYRQAELPDLVEKYNVNIALFSSTVPETYSYVMHEIIQLGMPVVSYDRGAQCDCAKEYRYGKVIPEVTPESTWKAIQELYCEMKGLNE